MVRRRNKYPEIGELVVCTVKTVNPNSVLVKLDEYGRSGMVHVSEISRKWVRDIRQHARVNEKIVCSVMRIDEEKDHINLSVKRVSENEKNKRMQEWKRDEKGEKLLEKLGKTNNMTLDDVYNKIGYDIQDSFRDMLEAFETALQDPEALERKGIDKSNAQMIKTIADKNIEIKEKSLNGYLNLKLYSSDGVLKIKKILSEAKKKYNVNVGYISAPKYLISFDTKDLKKGDKLLNDAAEFICSSIKKEKGDCEFSRDKEM